MNIFFFLAVWNKDGQDRSRTIIAYNGQEDGRGNEGENSLKKKEILN